MLQPGFGMERRGSKNLLVRQDLFVEARTMDDILSSKNHSTSSGRQKLPMVEVACKDRAIPDCTLDILGNRVAHWAAQEGHNDFDRPCDI